MDYAKMTLSCDVPGTYTIKMHNIYPCRWDRRSSRSCPSCNPCRWRSSRRGRNRRSPVTLSCDVPGTYTIKMHNIYPDIKAIYHADGTKYTAEELRTFDENNGYELSRDQKQIKIYNAEHEDGVLFEEAFPGEKIEYDQNLRGLRAGGSAGGIQGAAAALENARAHSPGHGILGPAFQVTAGILWSWLY